MSNRDAQVTLASLSKSLRRAATGEIKRQFVDAAAAFMRGEVMSRFALSRDPYGVGWAPLKHRNGRVLVKTGKLFGSIRVRKSSRQIRVYTNVAYAPYHQFGAELDARTIVQPRGRDGSFISRAQASRRRRGAVGVMIANIGVVKIPARPFMPDSRGLPPTWATRLREIAIEAYQRVMRS